MVDGIFPRIEGDINKRRLTFGAPQSRVNISFSVRLQR